MRKRSPPPRAGTSGSDGPELEGFVEGVRHRLQERREAGRPLPDLERRLTAANGAIVAGDVAGAERILLTISDRLDEDETEPELLQFPRGLIAYDAGSDRGVPTPEDEEPVGNRLKIVERLLAVAAREGVEVADLQQELSAARMQNVDGDWRSARDRGERILDTLDRRRAARAPREPI
jgi:hypothetical protein